MQSLVFLDAFDVGLFCRKSGHCQAVDFLQCRREYQKRDPANVLALCCFEGSFRCKYLNFLITFRLVYVLLINLWLL